MDSSPGNSLNIPSLVAFAIISFFAIRYFFFATPSLPSTTSSSSAGGRRTVPADRIEQITVMFPQLIRRDIEYDLLRNGASVQATTERVLREGRLPAAPPNFRSSSPPPNVQPVTANSSTTSGSTSSQPKPAHPDLITRYKLTSRVGGPAEVGGQVDDSAQIKGRQAWSQNKSEREALLKKKKEAMVLEARRRMEARESGKGKDTAL